MAQWFSCACYYYLGSCSGGLLQGNAKIDGNDDDRCKKRLEIKNSREAFFFSFNLREVLVAMVTEGREVLPSSSNIFYVIVHYKGVNIPEKCFQIYFMLFFSKNFKRKPVFIFHFKNEQVLVENCITMNEILISVIF